MTETAVNIEATSDTEEPLHPTDILMNLLVTLLAPMFLIASAGEIGYARMAAIETISAYRARDQADLIAIAQIVAFGLAALGSLSLSLADDISLSMTLRLRGNACALNRSAEQNRRTLREYRGDPPAQHRMQWPETPPADHGEPFPGPAAQPERAADSRLREPRTHRGPVAPSPTIGSAAAPMTAEAPVQPLWTSALIEQASKIPAGIAGGPLAERNTTSIRAAALSSTAHGLLSGGCRAET